VKKYLAYAGALAALAGLGNVAYAAEADDSLTWFGVTLYGTVDVGYTYQNRGTPLSDYFPVGLETMVQKNASKQISSLSENGMSQSKVGLRGTHEFLPGWSGVFKLETHFSPLSGNLSDGVKSVIQNNGVSQINQNTNGDSNRAGQAFGGAAYAGVSSPTYGTLTFGRQNSLLLDNISKYDPLGGSYAFSFLGYSGTSGGNGVTQDARLDNAVKYFNQVGKFRIAGMFASGGGGSPGNGIQADVGGDPLPGWSIDAAYANEKDAIIISPASAAQVTPCVAPATTGCLLPLIDPSTAVNATVSDNWSWEVATSYQWQQFKFSGAYEDIHFRNPQVHLNVGAPDIGGYVIGWVNNNAYPQSAKIIQYMWFGGKYSYNSHFDVYLAWYYFTQNNFNKTVHCPGGTADNAACSGREAGYSLVADYKFDRHFDIYAGAMYSHIADGLAAGPTQTTFTIDPTIGGRFNF
jgi:predicted porin